MHEIVIVFNCWHPDTDPCGLQSNSSWTTYTHMHWIESLLTSCLFTGKPLLSATFSALGYFPQHLILSSLQPFSWLLELDIPLTPMVEVSSEAGSSRCSSLPSALVTAISSSAPVSMGLWKWAFGWLMVPLMGLEVDWQCIVWAPTSCYFFLLFICRLVFFYHKTWHFRMQCKEPKIHYFCHDRVLPKRPWTCTIAYRFTNIIIIDPNVWN